MMLWLILLIIGIFTLGLVIGKYMSHGPVVIGDLIADSLVPTEDPYLLLQLDTDIGILKDNNMVSLRVIRRE